MRLLRFTGKRPKLPQGLGQAKELLARFGDAKVRKDQAESTLRDCYLYAVPHRETFNENMSELEKKNNHLFDSTAVIEVPKWAGRVQSKIMPPWREYSRLIPGPEIPREIAEDSRVMIGLKQATEITFAHINHSNFPSQVHESLQDLAVGTGCFNFWRGPLGGSKFLFDSVPMPELHLEEGPMSTIESTWRTPKIPVVNLQRIYPGIELTEAEIKLLKDLKGTEKVDKIEGVLYDPDTDRTWAVVIDASKKAQPAIVWSQMYPVSPRIVFRWSVTPGELYGRGPVMLALPDIKTANKVVEFILRHAALAIAGVYTSTADSSLNPYTIKIAPGVVVPVMSNAQKNPTIKALERSGDFALAFEVLEQIRKPIREAFMAHDLRPEGPVRSASEIIIEDRRLAEDNASVLGRLQTELVEKKMKRAVSILVEDGDLPPIRVDGRTITLKHQSPLARAQDMDELLNLQFGNEVMAPFGPEVTTIGLKVEDLAAWVYGKLGTDPRLIRSPAERARIQQQAAQITAQRPATAEAA